MPEFRALKEGECGSCLPDVTRRLRAGIVVRRRSDAKEPVGEAYRHPVVSVLRAVSAPATGECITLNTRGSCRTCAVASDQDFKGLCGAEDADS